MIEHLYNGLPIMQRPEDGYINLNQMFKACGKRLDHWLENKATKELFAEYEAQNGGETTPNQGELRAILTIEGRYGGSFAPPEISIQAAQYCSPKFALLCSKWIMDWMTTGKNPLVHALEHSEPDLAQLTTRELDIQDTEVLYEQQTNHINYFANKMQRARIARERTSRRLRYLHNDQLTLPMATIETQVTA
jgi:hypothetical protein